MTAVPLQSVLHLLYLDADYVNRVVPPVFHDCPAEFIPGKDGKYALCNITTEDTPCELLRELHKAKNFRFYGFTLVPVILSVLAMLLNIIYLIMQLRIYFREDESARKRYLFLISRSLSTIMSLILLYVVLICWQAKGFAYASTMIFMLLGSLNFLSITGTYVALTVLLYTAIVFPFYYREITIRNCYLLISLIWSISLLASTCVGLWGATLFYPDTAPLPCTFEGCQVPVVMLLGSGLALSCGSVLGIYATLIIELQIRLRRRGSLGGSVKCGRHDECQKSHIRAMKGLGINMMTFAIGSVPILIVYLVALWNLDSLASLGEGEKSPCKTYLNGRLFVKVEILAATAAIVWLIAMILDPIINTVADRKIMSMMKNWTRYFRKTVKSVHRKLTLTLSTQITNGTAAENEIVHT
ncbi:unnamed protein product [Cylicocyclus nassatus]|uniref:G-protein coupled receptors family 1 profile domain-containing protein n=1 Tax=Cylicocyclus nassatus TaxID=53992 RepID=A0AA36M4G3_CYLNA|nr:unnamed protein product [Cylicocyclus nassatus]